MTVLAISSDTCALEAANAVLVGIVKGPDGTEFATDLPSEWADPGELLASLTVMRASTDLERLTRTVVPGRPQQLVAVGLGDKASPGKSYGPELLRRATGTSVRALSGLDTASVVLPVNDVEDLRALAEGLLLGGYRFSAHKAVQAAVAQATFVVPPRCREQAENALRRATSVAGGVAWARDLVNSPPSVLGPEEFAELVRAAFDGTNVQFELLDEQALRVGGFGGIVGVGQGSARPPSLLHLSYRCAPAGTARLALVGKGITFDSGGLCLKPAADLPEMKMDMAGAAAVVASIKVVAELGLTADVEAWVPLAENMPGERALRPSDVVTMRNGIVVEVNDTDAEGRLILADAIARACEDKPDVLLDVATLTSAQMVALGTTMAAVMSNDDALRNTVVDAALRSGESAWGMPLPVELRTLLDSSVADLVNYGPREGAMLTAGLFLKEFVDKAVRWAHIDIAGPAYNRGTAYGYTPHGGSGAAVRTLVQVVEELSRK